MSLKTLYYFICLSLLVKNGICSNMGTEESLRQNLANLLEAKLEVSDDHLPFEEDELSDFTPKNQSEYDFIVIGAGSAGATIASRLSEIESVTVLLIEAGGKEYSILDIPSLATAPIQSNANFSWNYKTESSDEYCLAQQNHQCNWPRGKVMGGSSSIGGLLAMRGNRRDYDQWAEEIGDDSWSYTNMLKYFKKLENFNGNGIEIDSESRNIGGPVHVSIASHRPEISETFIKAGEELGYSKVDFNGPEQIGFSYFQTTTFEGERWSCNRAYLRPAKSRANLFVTQHSHVHKILIDEVTKNAYGVRYSKNGEMYEIKAKKEVILSAGAVSSPQILMLSGIGPESHLRELNIDVIKNSPVGENMVDHIRYGRGLTFSVNDSSTIQLPNVLDPTDPSVKNYINDKSGALSIGSTVQALSFINVDDRNNLHPDMELLLTPGDIWITKESTTTAKTSLKTYTIHPVSMRPRSRGKILLRSNDPLDKPKIYAGYLEDPDDIRVFIKGIRFAKKVGEANAMKKHNSTFQEFTSDCDVHSKDSDAYWECELRSQMVTASHNLGTCKMGPEDSSDAVVNTKLKVIGVKKLRVADASVMPNICAHTNIPVIAVGEKAADLIKAEYGY